MTRRISFALAQLVFLLSLSSVAHASVLQARDHLTPKEIDLVKDAQELGQRIDVFIKAADRRLMIINGTKPAPSKNQKADAELWGDLPTGSRSELVGDIAKILDEAITNIDDVSLRDEKNPALPKALRKLSAAATRIIDQLKPLESSVSTPTEASNFAQLMENAETIVDAASKLGPEAMKQKKVNSKQ